MFYVKRTEETAETDGQAEMSVAKMDPIDDTESYKLVKDVLETMGSTLEIMDGEGFTVNSAWYYVNTDLEGNLLGDSYSYLFVCDEERACLVFCKYGDACPYEFIPTSPFPYLNMAGGDVETVINDIVYEVIALDEETGQVR